MRLGTLSLERAKGEGVMFGADPGIPIKIVGGGGTDGLQVFLTVLPSIVAIIVVVLGNWSTRKNAEKGFAEARAVAAAAAETQKQIALAQIAAQATQSSEDNRVEAQFGQMAWLGEKRLEYYARTLEMYDELLTFGLELSVAGSLSVKKEIKAKFDPAWSKHDVLRDQLRIVASPEVRAAESACHTEVAEYIGPADQDFERPSWKPYKVLADRMCDDLLKPPTVAAVYPPAEASA